MMANKALQLTVAHRGRLVLAMDCALAEAGYRLWPAAEHSR